MESFNFNMEKCNLSGTLNILYLMKIQVIVKWQWKIIAKKSQIS